MQRAERRREDMTSRSFVRVTLVAACVLMMLASPLPAQREVVESPQVIRPKVAKMVYDMKKLVVPPSLTDDELKGRKLYHQRCGICHDRGLGPFLSQETIKTLGEDRVHEKVTKGERQMPGQQYALTPAQI